MKYSRLLSTALLAIVAAFTSSTFISQAAGECDKVIITEDEITRQAENTPPTDNWVLYTRNAGNGTFKTGPGTPPSGVGSLETATPTGADKVYLFNYDHVGTKLTDIDKIGYATYRTSGASANQVPAINIQVDVNGAAPGGFTTLVFEPVYNTNQGIVQDGVWQTWDAYLGGNAIWWSSNPIPSAPNRDTFVSWSTIVAANPEAVIVGGFGINQGSGNPALTASSDVLTIGSDGECVTYDFEPYKVAATPADCKNGGYNSVKDAQGNSFKNQGQCIQYVNTGK
jgi:hypothetical protein